MRPLKGLVGVFKCLFGMLASGLVIFFPVVRCGDSVRVRGELVEFGSPLVRVIWHSTPVLTSLLRLQPSRAPKLFNIGQSVVGLRRTARGSSNPGMGILAQGKEMNGVEAGPMCAH